jgi:Tfp pilus assembly protein PilF
MGKAVVANLAELLALALQYHRAGALAEAEPIYRQILTVDPHNAAALHLLGVLAHQQGDNDRAVDCIRRAVRLRPDHAEAHTHLGVVLRDQGKLEEAAACHREALRHKPDYTDALNNLGVVLRDLGKVDEAVPCYRQALRLQPDDPEINNNLGIALEEQGKPQEAIACYRAALRLRPDYAEALSNLGGLLTGQGKLDEAVVYLQQAISLKTDCAEVHNNLGVALTGQGKWDEAEASLRRALRLKPQYAQAHTNLANVFRERGRTDEAITAYRQALLWQPDHVEAHLNLGMALLLLGRFEEGWPEYEWRRRHREFPPSPFPQQWWDGSDLKGKTILLSAEQGFGDTLQFIRYAPLIERRGGRVIVGCPQPLLRLLESCAGIDHLTGSPDTVPPFDVQTSLLSLPGIFGTTLMTIPAAVPYLHADPTLAERWRRDLNRIEGFKVAIAWHGNPSNTDRRKVVPLTQFASLAEVEGVRLVSLQKGHGVEQLSALADRLRIVDLAPAIDDFRDTAAVLANVDLVITVDTALAHLAGAMGVPVWVALRWAADWRWLRQREDSPWYPTMRLFRQPEPGNWEAVFQRMAAELRDRCSPGASCTGAALRRPSI